MKGFFKYSFVTLGLVFLLTFIPGLGIEANAAKVKLNKKQVTLKVGDTTKLKITGTKKKPTWSSANKKVATVTKNGKVKAVGRKEGKTVIKAKVGKKTYKCNVTVINPRINNYKAIAKAYKSGKKSKLTYTDKKALAKTKSVLKSIIKKGMSDAEKAKACHDWIAQNTKYRSYTKGSDGQINYWDVLFNGKACCAGYTGAFQLFMECLGIQNEVAISRDHGWNVVKIDGKWYNVDVTYDDEDTANRISYWLFLVPDKLLPEGFTHTWIYKKKKCSSLDYELYPYDNLPVFRTTEDYRVFLQKLQSEMKVGEQRTVHYVTLSPFFGGDVGYVNVSDYNLFSPDGGTVNYDSKGGKYFIDKKIIKKIK